MFFELFHFWSVCFGVQTLMVIFELSTRWSSLTGPTTACKTRNSANKKSRKGEKHPKKGEKHPKKEKASEGSMRTFGI